MLGGKGVPAFTKGSPLWPTAKGKRTTCLKKKGRRVGAVNHVIGEGNEKRGKASFFECPGKELGCRLRRRGRGGRCPGKASQPVGEREESVLLSK